MIPTAGRHERRTGNEQRAHWARVLPIADRHDWVRGAIPDPFADWLRRVEASCTSLGVTDGRRRRGGTCDLQVGFANFALICRSLLCAATSGSLAADVSWGFASFHVPVAWLDELAHRAGSSDLDAAAQLWLNRAFGRPLEDPLRAGYEELVPRMVRRLLGEVYTPGWLADLVVEHVWQPGCSWFDPAVGGGAFGLALARCAARHGQPPGQFVGVDRNPWAILSSAANLAIAAAWSAKRAVPEYIVPLMHADVLTDRLEPAARVERVVGNPPWILWDNLPRRYLDETAPLWRHYGLLAEAGMAAILGGGKKDLAMLMTSVVADRYLAARGKLAFVITGSVLTSARSGRGFRRWQLPDGTPLRVERVDDVSALRPFAEAQGKGVVIVLQKGAVTRFPVPYHVWTRSRDGPTYEHEAEPADPDDPLSTWRRLDPRLAPLLGAVLGRCDYRAHLGVNTGGANGVYWLERRAIVSDGLWHMRNLVERGKRAVRATEALLEPVYLYPTLIGKDVRAWLACPSAWVLLVQDSHRRRGLDPAELHQRAPRSLEYLRGFEDILRARAAFRRYFVRLHKDGRRVESAPFYSMFDVGPYVSAPAKVVWNRMGHRLAAAVVTALEGKPVQAQETHGLFALESLDAGHYLAALLNSRWAQVALESIGQVGGKSFATPSTVHRLRLTRFDPSDTVHQALVEVGRRAAAGAALSGQPPAATQLAVDRLAAGYWGLDPAAPTKW